MKYEATCLPMKRSKKPKRLITEELYSRIEIQQRSLQTYSKEIFENVGQVLSLVKLQLQTEDQNSIGKIEDAGKLLGKAIADLRNLTKQLSPDEIIKNGFAYAIKYELKRIFEAGLCKTELTEDGDSILLEDVKALVVFCVLQQLIHPVLSIDQSGVFHLKVQYRESKIEIEVSREFNKEPLFLNIEEMAKFKQRLNTINGLISYKHGDWNTLQITINI